MAQSLASEVTTAVREAALEATGQADAVTTAAVVTSVLPAGLYTDDERVQALTDIVTPQSDPRAAAILQGTPRARCNSSSSPPGDPLAAERRGEFGESRPTVDAADVSRFLLPQVRRRS